jgi:uncharacterized protein YacL (UPF0231 family)
MVSLTIDDFPEWNDIKRSFVNGGASPKSRILAIQRLTKEYAVWMDDAEVIVDKWRREFQEEARKTREIFTIGDAVRSRSNFKK